MELDQITQHHDVVAAAIVRYDTVLLCHRHPDREWYPNVWDVPGGHINPGESPINALVREMREELGIEIDATRAVSVLRDSPTPDLDIEIWAVASWEGDIANTEPAEHDEIRWFVAAELDNIDLADADVAIACRRAIEHFARHPPGIGAQ
jgi:8-oxo-dGTP diphosphatase